MEDSSLYPITCGFCRHGNPESSRYCNRCGAPLTAEPCPQCGSVNDVVAATCERCGAPLADRDSQQDDFFLPLPPEVPVPPRSTPHPAEVKADAVPARTAVAVADSGILDDAPSVAAEGSVADELPNELVVPSPREEATMPTSALRPAETTTDTRPDTVATSALPPAPPATVASEVFRNRDARRPRRRILTSAVVLAGLAATGYFAYRHFQQFQPSDAAPRMATTSGAKDTTIQGAPGKPIAAPAAAPATVAANPPAGAQPAPASPGAIQAKATAGENTGGKGGRGVDPAGESPARPQTDIFMKTDSEPGRAPPSAQDASKTAADGTRGEVRRPATGIGGGVAQRAPGTGPCTDAVAALGLCTRENTQGRKP